ncbi:TerB family tellurite resistance protein [Halomonas sp. NO4]|uniref:tellurite resistance TerB family protein n=1 Tax=Halomonas sp. NO4 TaxID=2484813 RepID=UPI0013D17581|nr:TerB family tellurite resistance protein [Halomonas sp. NO4]
MLDRIQRFFQHALADPDASDDAAPTLELATAALLFEVARADYHLDDSELALLRDQLGRRFGLSSDALEELLQMAGEEAEQAVDHYQFVSLVKQHYGYAERCELVRMMWTLALADGEAHHLEEHRIRRLAELLHVSHSDFIRTKLQAQDAAPES